MEVMQLAPSGGQIWNQYASGKIGNQCKWRHLVAKFAANSRSFTEINLPLLKVNTTQYYLKSKLFLLEFYSTDVGVKECSEDCQLRKECRCDKCTCCASCRRKCKCNFALAEYDDSLARLLLPNISPEYLWVPKFCFCKICFFSKYHLTLFSRATKVITDSWVALEDEEDEEGSEEVEETDVESDGGVEEVFELF